MEHASPTEVKQAIEQLKEHSRTYFKKISSVFPFQIFPDTVIVDERKVDIIYRDFFFVKKVFPIMIDDIRTVKVSTGVFFASMEFEVIGYEENPTPISYLPKNAAIEMRDIILGLVKTVREQIPIHQLERKGLKRDLQKVGRAHQKLAGIV